MQNDIKLYTELLELLNMQTETINKQNKIITELVNDNLEKENMINVLMREQLD